MLLPICSAVVDGDGVAANVSFNAIESDMKGVMRWGEFGLDGSY